MTVHHLLKQASVTLIVTALVMPLHVSAGEPDGLATQFQASAASAAASFRKELKVNLAKSIGRLDTSLAIATKNLADVDRKERQMSLDQPNESG